MLFPCFMSVGIYVLTSLIHDSGLVEAEVVCSKACNAVCSLNAL